MTLSINSIKLAYQLGYRIVEGEAYTKDDKLLSKRLNSTGRYVFGIRIPVRFSNGKRITRSIPIHRLVAYQKYGDAMLVPKILVRHKDGNHLNNLESNILIGTSSDNMMDQSSEVRLKKAIDASAKNRILTDEEIISLKKDRFENGLTYQQLSDKYDIGSKGHAHYIANHDYVTSRTK